LFQALRFLRSHSKEFQPKHTTIAHFLEEAEATKDEQLFYTVFIFFKSRDWIDSHHHEKYIKLYEDLISRSQQ
jgi:hypothetical protein